jgi:hypothetical protein
MSIKRGDLIKYLSENGFYLLLIIIQEKII